MANHEDHHEGHGNSVAAWVATGVMLVSFALGCLGLVFDNGSMLYAGIAGFLIGAVLWPVLSRMGFGDKSPARSLYS